MNKPKTKEVSEKFAEAIIQLLHTYNKRLAMKILVLLIYKLQARKWEFE
jgi:hypothetical protein